MKTLKKKFSPIRVFFVTWPINLKFSNRGFNLEFPLQQKGVQFPNVCTNLSKDKFCISFPKNISVTIPNSNGDIILNDEPFNLPLSESGRLVVNFPNGGSINFPNGWEATMDPLPNNATMDTLPRFFKLTGKRATIKAC